MLFRSVTFQSHIDGARHVLTPERSMEIQGLLGSDIQMQFDECVKLPCSDAEVERAMRLSEDVIRYLTVKQTGPMPPPRALVTAEAAPASTASTPATTPAEE